MYLFACYLWSMDKKREPNVHELMLVSIMRASEIIQYRVNQYLKAEYEITNAQYNILRILRGADGEISIKQIRSRMLFGTSDVSRLLDRLVYKELVARKVCPDNRRQMDVSISKKGLKMLSELDVKLEENLDGFYKEKFSLKEAKDIVAKLSRFDREGT